LTINDNTMIFYCVLFVSIYLWCCIDIIVDRRMTSDAQKTSKRLTGRTRTSGTNVLTYDQFKLDCEDGGIVAQEVDKINHVLGDKRPIKLVVKSKHVASVHKTRCTDDFNFKLKLKKMALSGGFITLFLLCFNCDMLCKASLPTLPEVISDRALLHHLSLQHFSFPLGKLKIDSLGVLFTWLRKVALLEVCTGMSINYYCVYFVETYKYLSPVGIKNG